VEWFKLSKPRAVTPPKDITVATVPETETLAAKLAAMPSPKTVFDTPAAPRPLVRPVTPAAKVGFTISSSKDGASNELQLTSPTLTVAKARMLFKSGWRVHITNAAGRQFAPSEFDQVLKFD
jgi:hypothetical protein